MSICVSVTVRSVVVETKTVLKQNFGPDIVAYYKMFTNSDVIEGLDVPIQLTNSQLSPIRFNPLSYQLHIISATEQMKFQLYFKSATQQPTRASAEFAFLISKQFGTLPTKVVTLSFDRSCAIQGTVVLELALTVGEQQTPSFKKTNMDVSQFTNNTSSPNTGSRIKMPGSKTRVQKSKPTGNTKQGFMFWKSTPKRGGKKFGSKLDPNCEEVPEIMLQVIPCLEKNALSLKGIFRESAPALEVEDKIKKFESGKEMFWENIENQHVVAGVLMAYLLQLPEPLIPYDLYDSFIAAEETVTVRDERASFVNKLLKTLPTANRVILQYLIKFLNKLSKHAEVNMMTAHNVGIVFAPALLRKEFEDVKQIIADSPLVINAIKIIVEEYKFFFEHGELLGEKAFEELAKNDSSAPDSGSISPTPSRTSRDPELFKKFMQSVEDFATFQDQLSSSIQLLKRNIQLIISDLDLPKNFTPSDIQALNTLINSFHTLIDNPDVDTDQLTKSVISNEIANNVTGQCKTLQFAFRSVLDRLQSLEDQVDETAFDKQAVYIEANIGLSRTVERMKQTFDHAQTTLLAKRGSSVDKHLATVRRVIQTISENIRVTCVNALKRELGKQKSLAGAVAIARVTRSVIQALSDESLELLGPTIPRPAITVTTNPTDLKRLQAVSEVMDHAFQEIEKVIKAIQSRVDSIFSVIDSRPLVQLLVGVKKYINTYLTSEPVQDEEKPKLPATTASSGGRSQLTQSFEDASLPEARAAANRILTVFRSLLNGILMEVDSVTNFMAANNLALLGEKCRVIAELSESEPKRRTRGADRHMSVGRLFVIKKLCSESFDDIRGYMFEANKIISQSNNVTEIAHVSEKLSQLIQELQEYKSQKNK